MLAGSSTSPARASADKLKANQELLDLIQALGCGTREKFEERKLRHERIIIMTDADADVDGAHIASLLMTFAGNPFRDEAERHPGHLIVMALKDAPDAKALQAAIPGPELTRAKADSSASPTPTASAARTSPTASSRTTSRSAALAAIGTLL